MGKRWLAFVLFFGAAGLGAAVRASGVEMVPNENQLTLPPTTIPPTIDGVIGEEEWRHALKINGFVETFSPFIEPRQGFTCVAYDSESLYVAVSSELPPNGKLVTTVTQRDENTVHDDSIEIWFDPNRANKLAGKGDQRYYQMIINDIGNLLDCAVDPAKGVPNSAWDLKGHTMKTRLNPETRRWEFELALPWKSFDIDSTQLTNRVIGLLVARNFKFPWVQAPYLPGGGFSNWKNAPLITLRPDAPFVQEQGFGAVFEGVVTYQSTILNPSTAPMSLRVTTTVTPSDMPEVKRTETLTIPAGAAAPYRFTLEKGYLHKESQFASKTTVISADGQMVYFNRTFSVKPPREKTWDIGSVSEEVMPLYIAYHPSTRNLSVKLDLADLKGGDKATGAKAEVLNQNGGQVASAELTVGKGLGERSFTLPGLPNGTYTVRTTLRGEGAASKLFEKPFVIRHFPWENCCLGITDRVFPPFTPVMTKGRQVNVVLRRYTMNGFGLWDSVVSKGQELLAAPMSLQFTTRAGRGEWTARSGSFSEAKENHASYQSHASSPTVEVTTTSVIEEDGCMKVTMELKPGKSSVEVEALWVEIPLRDSVVSLWHVCQSGNIRTNPVGYAPAGQGQVWDSTQTGNGAMLGSILPYLWLGGAERGLAFFCDNDRGWIVDDAKPQMTLTRDKDRLVLRLHLINKPTTLKEPRTLVFGLQASPTKPMPRDYRTRKDVPMHGGSNGYWGILSTFAGKYPAQNDYSYVDEMLAERASGQPNPEFLSKWIKEKIEAVSDDPKWIKDRIAHVGGGFGSMPSKGMTPAMLYFEEHYHEQATPEWVAYQDEWGVKPYTKREWATRPDKGWGVANSFPKSYQDFALWHAMQWYSRGMGLYCDNTFPHNNYSPAFSSAYVRQDGQVQPSSEMWNLREYHKRMWTLQQQCQPLTPYPLMISLHMTNGNLLPIITWADISLDNEWGWNGATEPFPPEVLRTEMTGLHVGNYPHALYPVFGVNNTTHGLSKEKVERIEWGMRFVHEILRSGGALEDFMRKFGYGREGCQVVHYWETTEGTPGKLELAVSNDKVKWLALWRPADQRLLVALVNWTKDPQTTDVVVKKPTRATVAECKDAETGRACLPEAINLDQWGVRLVELSVSKGRR